MKALIVAKLCGVDLDFRQASAIDLAERDVVEAVKTCAKTEVFITPEVLVEAADGVKLLAYAKVTVQPNIQYIIGGEDEETLINRISTGIITLSKYVKTHTEILNDLDHMAELLLSMNPDSETTYKIVEIKIIVEPININKNE